MSAADDARYMAAALRLSRWHEGQTETNPSVGCIIVRDGAIVGAAVTAIGGRPHAETQALAIAGEKARGATVYVTLEPCAHYGRTPPCANALVAAGVGRVVICLTDPDPRVSGHGIAILEEAGIRVETGLLEEEGRRTLAAYLSRQVKKRPYVTLKLAVSLDGMLGRRGEEVSITGPLARAQVHVLRAESDAILVGIGTVRCDDPELNVRLPGMRDRSPIRVILDRRLELPLTSNLVRSVRDVPVIVASVGILPPSSLADISTSRAEITDAAAHAPSCRCGEDHDHSSAVQDVNDKAGQGAHPQPISPLEREMPGRTEGGDLAPTVADPARKALIAAGVQIIDAPTLSDLLHILATHGISSLFVEGGAAVARAFLDADLVDRVIVSQGPVTIGEGGLESPLTPSDMPEKFRAVRKDMFGPDSAYEYERGF
jgi:diaminohydroxyphosphoribosylaminopyrimidine deaminase/5-amino-6-(5-phosphoribosylamino)uracil reductase